MTFKAIHYIYFIALPLLQLNPGPNFLAQSPFLLQEMRLSFTAVIDIFWLPKHALSKDLAALIFLYLSSNGLGQCTKPVKGTVLTISIALHLSTARAIV